MYHWQAAHRVSMGHSCTYNTVDADEDNSSTVERWAKSDHVKQNQTLESPKITPKQRIKLILFRKPDGLDIEMDRRYQSCRACGGGAGAGDGINLTGN